jgi:DNA-binding response OmpR family regulator
MNENILLVEDEEPMRMVLNDRLRSEGYLVDNAFDAETGFEKANSSSFNLLIVDIILPRRSGLELCSDIRTAGLATPILLLTALDDSVVEMAGRKAGADDYLTKPFNMLDLTTRVERLLSLESASENGRGRLPQGQSALTSDPLRLVETAGEDLISDPASLQYRKLRKELDRRIAARKDRALLKELTRQLREKVDEEKDGPQTNRNNVFLNVADGVVGFLEEILHEAHSPKRGR